ncbi:MAG: Perchlorate reductase subunit gamma [Anaerolineales bacterium]|nr:Perchlorate reductase subunit gamma [Anaerolineales bacterium]
MSSKKRFSNGAYLLPILVIILGTTLFAGSTVQVFAEPPNESGQPEQTTVQDPSTCAKCHTEQYEAWQTSTHSSAFSAPTFQKTWERANRIGDCLTCHVTGYSADTGTAEAAGVTCQACHTTMGEAHPLTAMAVPVSSETCGKCHEKTLEEWVQSDHGKHSAECIACHQSHSQTIRIEPEQALCDSCHEHQMESLPFKEEARASMTCNTCHMPEKRADTVASGIGGLDAISHTFNVGSETCARCHEDATHGPGHDVYSKQVKRESPQFYVDREGEAIRAARERVRVLESENASLERQVEKHQSLALFGSAFGFGTGSFAGLVSTLVLLYALERGRQ